MGILGFIFGKKPGLNFTKAGKVSHNHKPEYWEAWKKRFSQDPNLNWKNHAGVKNQPKK